MEAPIGYNSDLGKINRQLSVFAVNMKVAYGGINTVEAQIGYNSDLGRENIQNKKSESLIA